MIRNLLGAGKIHRDADVLVIGAGTVGLVMATALHKRGLRVVCLESGDEHQDDDTHVLNAVEHARTPYAGAAHGRFRCLGGTSTRWGGALIPFAAADLDPKIWPIAMSDLTPYLGEVEALFGLPAGPYEFPDVLGRKSAHVARLAKWPPFRKRNVLTLVGDAARGTDGPEVWLNATASKFLVNDGALAETTASAPDGSCVVVRATEVVFACGAIESTRLLLLLDRQNGHAISSHTRWLGAGFFDHLSAVVAELDVQDRRALNRLVGFRFEASGVMRNMRFELAELTTLRESLPACFAHIAFEPGPSGGFNELRDLFRVLQRSRWPGLAQLGRLAAESPWLARAVYWRLIEKRLLYPADARIQLHMVIDQEAISENRITLSENLKDPYGQPQACIDWSVTPRDRARISAATDAVLESWSSSWLAALANPVRRPAAEVLQSMEQGGGIYHPGGSTRMAHRAMDGVVDSHSRVFQIPNVRVVATSVMPTGGGANPTMTLLALALRCVDDLVQTRRST